MKKEFDNCIAILQEPNSCKSVATPWKNIPVLREMRRTENRFKKAKIIRKDKSVIFGPDLIDYHLGATETFPFDYFSDMRFYKFYENQKRIITKWFNSIDLEVYSLCTTASGITIHDVVPCIIPSWFLEFVGKEFPVVDMTYYGSEYSFIRKIQRDYYDYFSEMKVVQDFFYTRFEASLKGTLEPDIIQDLKALHKRFAENNTKKKNSIKTYDIDWSNFSDTLKSYNGNGYYTVSGGMNMWNNVTDGRF